MALPKIQTPTQTFFLPIAKKKITFRRFTVKEEKILLMAAEAGTQEDMLQAFKQVINNCVVDDLDVASLPLFDLQLLFLVLRVNSVSNTAEFRIKDVDDGEIYNIEVDLQQVVSQASNDIVIPDNKIQLTDDVGVIMKHATLRTFEDQDLFASDTVLTKDAFNMLAGMIEKVYDENNVYLVKDFSLEEITEFIESFTPDAMAKVEQYIEALPELKYEQKYKRKDGSDGTLKLLGMADFFQYA